MKLWLDDIRPAPEGWKWAKTCADAFNIIYVFLGESNEEWTDLALDHDLGEQHEDAIEFVKWLDTHNLWPTNRPTIHSMNPVGRKNMEFYISRKYDECEIPL